MSEDLRFDVVVLGAGSAGEWFAADALGLSVAVVESGRVGGECPYVACVPSKALLRAAHLRRLLRRAEELGAVGEPLALGSDALAFSRACHRRDEVAEYRDDTAAADRLRATGTVLLRGVGRVAGPGRVVVRTPEGAERSLAYETLVIATGSEAVLPSIPGLEEVPFWTSDIALSSDELPRSLAVIGGGAVGCELAQVYASFGTKVLLLEQEEHLLPREAPVLGEMLGRSLRQSGVVVLTGVGCRALRPDGAAVRLDLDDGSVRRVDRLLVATGRRPRLAELGLETLGLDTGSLGVGGLGVGGTRPDESAESRPDETRRPAGGLRLRVDDRCRVVGLSNVYAVGDASGLVPFTHTANYQARVVLAQLHRGRDPLSDFDLTVAAGSIPRAVYTDPPVAAVGLTPAEADRAGRTIGRATMSFGETGRAFCDGVSDGELFLLADLDLGVLIGAGLVGPAADEMVGEVALAIRAQVPLDVLSDVVHPFPTYSEALEPPLRELARRVRERRLAGGRPTEATN